MAHADLEPLDDLLLGREREMASLVALLAGRSGALLIRGAPGIGKTSLLMAAANRARALGFRVLSTAGSEAETTFAFAGLQPLLVPLLEVRVEMPQHLNTALLSALGLLDAGVPALETVGLAVLVLLGGVADTEQPLCLLVDDVQWLDASSAEVLRFVSRRLSADPVVLLAAGRDRGWPPAGAFPEVQVEPLGRAAAEAVVTRRAQRLSKPARDRVLDQAEGNPLALVELSGAISGEPQRPLPAALPLTARLEAAFIGRASELSEMTRAVLLVAALAPAADIRGVLAAAGVLGGSPVELVALDEAVRLDLISVDDRNVHFRHPLVRSGLVHAAAPSQRRAAHEALAGTLDDRERALHHRAAATVGYDELLAGELEASAGLALRRGSLASAVAALEEAARLTRPGSRCSARLIRAAELAFELGRPQHVRDLLSQTVGGDLALSARATARWLGMAVNGGYINDARSVRQVMPLVREAIAAGEDDSALRLLAAAAEQITWGSRGLELGRAIVAAARRVPGSQTDPRVTALLASALPIDAHHELAARLAVIDEEALTDPESQRLIAFAAVIYGDYDLSARLLVRAEEQFRREGRLSVLATVLTFRGVIAFSRGEWRLAEQVLDEAERLAEETNQVGWLNRARHLQAGVAGLQGDEERHRDIIGEQTLAQQRTNDSRGENHLGFMQGISAAMLGRHDDALALLSGLFDPSDPIFDPPTCAKAMFYLADVAAVKDRADAVENAIEVVSTAVPLPWSPLFQAAVDYAQAVTGAEAEGGERFERALAGPAGGRAFDRARVQLAYGQWLRRHQRRLEAREQLRAARDIFERLGNEPFARRARDELRATGEGSPRRRDADWDRLSPQEVQIARLVTQGLSNKEIGERMFLSHRTIASHLYRIFPKLGITSRAQLAAAMNVE